MTALTYVGFSVRINYHRRKLAQIILPVSTQFQEEPLELQNEGNQGTQNTQGTQDISSSSNEPSSQPSLELSGNNSLTSPNFACFSPNKASITFAAIAFLSMSIMTESFMWSYVTNNMTPKQIMDDSFGTLVVYWHQNFGPMLFAWGFLTISYSRNPALRKSRIHSTFCNSYKTKYF